MMTPPRRARFGRHVLYAVAWLMTTHCRCQYELVALEVANDGGADATVDAATDAPIEAGVTPPSIVFDTPTLTDRKGGTIGNAFSETCPAEQVMYGIEGGVQPDGFQLLTAIAFRCATLTVAADGMTVIVTPAGTLPLRGDTTWSDPFSQTCPANQVVTGFEGNAGSSFDGITIKCTPISVQGGMVAFGTTTAIVPAIGGNGGTPYDEPCPAGKIARGGYGYENGVMQGFGMSCATPSLMAAP